MAYQPPSRRRINKHWIIYPLVALTCIGIGTASSGNADAKPPTSAPLAAPGATTMSTTTTTVTSTSAPQVTTVTKAAKAAATVTRTKTTTVTAAADSGGSGGGAVYYANCSEARAAGAAPLHVGDPGYRSGLDRDGDGVACE